MSTEARVAGALFLAIVGLGACKPDDATPPDYPAAVAEARKMGEELDRERRDALVKASGTIVARPDLGRCPVDVKLPGLQYEAIMPNQVKLSMMGARPGLDVIAASELATIKGPTLGHQTVLLSLLDGDARRGEPGVVAKAKEMGTREWFDVDLVVVVDARTDPQIVGNGLFKSGELAGHAYLWSYKERAILCMATVNVESSDQVDVAGGSPEYLRGDLDAQAILQAKARLMRAGPPMDLRPASSPSASAAAAPTPKRPTK